MDPPRRFSIVSVLLLLAATLLGVGNPASVVQSQTTAFVTTSDFAVTLQGLAPRGAATAERPLVTRAARFDVSPSLQVMAATHPGPARSASPDWQMPRGQRPVPS